LKEQNCKIFKDIYELFIMIYDNKNHFKLICIYLVLVFTSCQSGINERSATNILIEELNSIEKRNLYLEKIYESDQAFRNKLEAKGLNDLVVELL